MLKKWIPGALHRPQPAKVPSTIGKPEEPVAAVKVPIESSSTQSQGVPWTEDDIRKGMDEFMKVFAQRPIANTDGGLSSVGMFALWTMLRAIRPTLVLECGVFKGQTTWLIEKAVPSIPVLSLDIDPGGREYTSPTAEYQDIGFMEFEAEPEKVFSGAVAFFDDHGDVFHRVEKCRHLGIKYIIFDDNYPEGGGNRHRSLSVILAENTGPRKRPSLENATLREWMEWSVIFPPIFDWIQPITQERSAIELPSLFGEFDLKKQAKYQALYEGMEGYRWPTCIRLK